MARPRSNDGTLIGYFEGTNDDDGTFQHGTSEIGMAVSLDGGATWTPRQQPVLTVGAQGAFDDHACESPWAVKVGGRIYLYYSGYSGTNFQIGLATSTDGVNFQKQPAPVIANGTTYDLTQARYPVVWYDANEFDPCLRWKMLYQGYNANTSQYSINTAFSPDGLTWNKLETLNLIDNLPGTTAPSNPVILPGPAGSFDSISVAPGCVYFNGYWYLLYAGGGSVGTNPYQIGLAYSRDFIRWYKYTNAFGPGGIPYLLIGARNAAIATLAAPFAVGAQQIRVVPGAPATRIFEPDEPVVLYTAPPPAGGTPLLQAHEMLFKVKSQSSATVFGAGPNHSILLDKPMFDFNGVIGGAYPANTTIVRSILSGSIFPRMMIRQGDSFKVSISCHFYIPQTVLDNFPETSGQRIRGCVIMAEGRLPDLRLNPAYVQPDTFQFDYVNAPVLQAGRYVDTDRGTFPGPLWNFRSSLHLCCLLDFDCEGELNDYGVPDPPVGNADCDHL